ncbi:Major Facilitator Superfamily protein [Sulfobacillus thermosulfidooxidans DSM 9293]|uniref:Major Facilitator Superfamily protein n=1 Tax=Sulfobacillus thermosulfidooxidans (strain DSM 9293 / VKM B-1269 / AT-1) TaxID=929705 RepID=A0A1W1WAZ6_SULTA|nr:MFS transporter [Sulfobacillus thermosulfidooxidans]SMC03478.1 Major Facilitator Superfamily protein [Sulfobacillus thermosulfidooxidans DSM 9293]
MAQKPNNALIAFYFFTGLWSFDATNGLWILYLVHCHWSLFQIGMAEAGFHLVSLLSDVPTGAFADRFGRRQSLVLGLLIWTTAPVMTFVFAPLSVVFGVFSISLGALSWTFIGGADQALLYGLTQSQPLSYARIYGRLTALSLSATAIAITAGGFLVSHGGWIYPYLLTPATNLIAVIPILSIPEPEPKEPKSETRVLTAIQQAGRITSQDVTLRWTPLSRQIFDPQSVRLASFPFGYHRGLYPPVWRGPLIGPPPNGRPSPKGCLSGLT